MKIKPAHYDHLKTELLKLYTPELQQQYAANGLTPMRYRWDLLYAAGLSPWICDKLYSYLNDDHIDTALRNIIKGA